MSDDRHKAPKSPRRGNFFYLFAALLVLTIVGPVMSVAFGTVGGLFAEVSLSLTLLIALWSLHSTRRVFVAGLVLIAVNIPATAVWIFFGQAAASGIAHVAGLAFLALTGVLAVQAILRTGPVDLNKVLGALCVYLLMGVYWAELYQLLHGFDPASFSGVDQLQGHALSWRYLYFSFVTLTTLGYGDILPQTIYAQSLTVMETVIGQLYLAVLVAALVSAYLSDVRGGSDADARDGGAEH